MHITREAVFAPLRAALVSQDAHDYTLIEVIAGFTLSSPLVAHAMSMHAINYLRQHGDVTMTYAEVIAEVYRLTFFEEEGERWGLEIWSIDLLSKFVTYMIDAMSMDDRAEATGKVVCVTPDAIQ